MAEELGKIEKPPVEKYKTGRKLIFAPLIFTPREPQTDFLELIKSYWSQVEAQVSKLEAMLNDADRVYHELITVGGKKGMKVIKELNSGSYRVTNTRVKKGAKLQPIEDGELLTEFMDWSRCLAVGLQNPKVFARVYESYIEVQKRRNDHIARQIDETLKDNGIGILLMREGHQVQFPADIEVFYIAPPSLDEIKRWLRARETETQN